MWRRAAWAALVGIACYSGIYSHGDCGSPDGRRVGINRHEGLIWTGFVEFVKKSRLMVLGSIWEKVVDAADNDDGIGFVVSQAVYLVSAYEEMIPLKIFLARKKCLTVDYCFWWDLAARLTGLEGRSTVLGWPNYIHIPNNNGIFCRCSADVFHPKGNAEANTSRDYLQARLLDLGAGEIDPWALIVFHGFELPLHNGQLSLEGTVLESPYADNNEGQDGYPKGRVSRSAPKTILGVFFLALGAAIMKIAFYFGDAPRPKRNDRRLMWGMGTVAAFMIGQGTILALSGNWLP